MAKRTAIIDLGTNGIRIAIFERTSRFGFYIINEQKLKIRLSEGAYEKGGTLQEEPMKNAKEALRYFVNISKNYKCKKIICIGTSALRDAPNANEFINDIKKELKLNIKCVDGEKESFLGGFAALTLLANIKNATTIDIGGGSCELCAIKDGKITNTMSLKLGTIRLKELYDISSKKLEDFIEDSLIQIPKEYKNENIIAIGGSLRALSNAIIEKNSYPHNKVHNFCYQIENEKKFLSSIIKSDNLSDYGIKKDRHDTIKYGTLIFLKLTKYLSAKTITTSGVGVREGVILKDILGKFSAFPENTNPSLRSLQDRFEVIDCKKTHIYAKKLFEILQPLHNLNNRYLQDLVTAAKLSTMGIKTSFYSKHNHAGYLALNGLNFRYTHEQKALIYTILSLHGKKPTPSKLKELLPSDEVIIWLNFILATSVMLSKDLTSDSLEFELVEDKLIVKNKTNTIFLKDEYKKIYKPEPIELIFL